MRHCSSGIGCDTFDLLTPIRMWVEKGIAPDEIVGSRVVNNQTVRTRPLCPYPEVARYLGTGSIDDESNFVCVNTVPAKVEFSPEIVTLGKGKRFTATIRYPSGYNVHGFSAVVCEGAKADRLTHSR
jgi:hypothetical protein